MAGKRSPAHLFVASFPWSAWAHIECALVIRSRSWISAHVHVFQADGGVPDILDQDNCATATDMRRKSVAVKVNYSFENEIEKGAIRWRERYAWL